MPRAVKEERLDSKTARAELPARDKPYKRTINEGVHLGYRRAAQGAGKWVEFIYLGRSGAYKTETFATADDGKLKANGIDILDYDQAVVELMARVAKRQRETGRLELVKARAEERRELGLPAMRTGTYTVHDAMNDYITELKRAGQKDAVYRVELENKNWIEPHLGNIECAAGKLTTARLNAWLDMIVSTPARETRHRAWAKKNEALLQQIRGIIEDERPFRPGYLRVTVRLQADGIKVGPQRVLALMRDNNLLSRRRSEEVAEAVELRQQGLSLATIAGRMGRTAKTIKSYLNRGPAPPHPATNSPKPKPPVVIDDPIVMRRRRRKTASGTQAYLVAALNAAWRREDIDSATREAWQRMKKFKGVTGARQDYLRKPEALRLVAAAESVIGPEFAELLQGNIHCGARISEMRRFRVRDYNDDVGVLNVIYSKADETADVCGRVIRLSPEGAKFFHSMTVGRNRDELIFRRPDGSAWKADNQFDLKRAAKRANLGRHISMGIFRHTWASNSIMAGMPLPVVAEQMGHTTVQMVQKHYGHIGDDWIAEQTRKHGSNYGFPERNVVGLAR